MLHLGLCKLHLACRLLPCWASPHWDPRTGPVEDKRLKEKKGICSFSSVSEDFLSMVAPLNQCFFTLIASVPSYNSIWIKFAIFFSTLKTSLRDTSTIQLVPPQRFWVSALWSPFPKFLSSNDSNHIKLKSPLRELALRSLIDWLSRLWLSLWSHDPIELRSNSNFLPLPFPIPSPDKFLVMPGHSAVLVPAHSYGQLWLGTPHRSDQNIFRTAPSSESFLPLFSQVSDLSQGLKIFSACLCFLPIYLPHVSPNKSLVHRISPWWLLLQWTNTEVIVTQARNDTSLKGHVDGEDGEKGTDITFIDMYYCEIMHSSWQLCD